MARGASLKAGDKLGPYELLVPVGAGGMGRVWAARERASMLAPRLVAIKTALAEDGATDAFWKVLLDEARIASQVHHPNVCGIHEVERERGIVYLVMDWSDGGSLRELLDALPNHRLEPPVAARIVSRICSGLHAAHELVGEDGHPLGVVHRDVSPQNVLIAASGQVRLTDFGVAKARGQIHAPTQTGEVKGKIAYMAPEQVTTKDVDRRADVFALGCVLYEATVGARPFQGGDALATLYQLLEEPVKPPSERLAGYPPALEAIVMTALERDPARRYPTAEALGRELETFLVKARASVSDATVASVLATALGERIATRGSEIQDAIDALDNPQPSKPPSIKAPPPAIKDPSEAATLAGSSRPVARSQRKPRARVLLIGGAALVGLVTVIAFATRDGESDEVASGVAPSVAPTPALPASAEPATPDPTPASIDVTIRAEPAHAKIYIDDGPALENPHHELVAPGDQPRRVRAAAEGYEDREQVTAFDRQKEIVLVLRERAKTARRPASRPAVAPAPGPTETEKPAARPTSLPPVIKRPVRTLDQDNPFAPKP